MGEALSQNEIDNLLAALSSGELDTDELNGADENRLGITTLNGLPSSQRNICARWKLYMSIMGVCSLRVCRCI